MQVNGDVLADRESKGTAATRPVAVRQVTGYEDYDKVSMQHVMIPAAGKTIDVIPRLWSGEFSAVPDNVGTPKDVFGDNEIYQIVRPKVDNINGLKICLDSTAGGSGTYFETMGTYTHLYSGGHADQVSGIGGVVVEGGSSITDAAAPWVGAVLAPANHIALMNASGMIEGLYKIVSPKVSNAILNLLTFSGVAFKWPKSQSNIIWTMPTVASSCTMTLGSNAISNAAALFCAGDVGKFVWVFIDDVTSPNNGFSTVVEVTSVTGVNTILNVDDLNGAAYKAPFTSTLVTVVLFDDPPYQNWVPVNASSFVGKYGTTNEAKVMYRQTKAGNDNEFGVFYGEPTQRFLPISTTINPDYFTADIRVDGNPTKENPCLFDLSIKDSKGNYIVMRSGVDSLAKQTVCFDINDFYDSSPSEVDWTDLTEFSIVTPMKVNNCTCIGFWLGNIVAYRGLGIVKFELWHYDGVGAPPNPTGIAGFSPVVPDGASAVTDLVAVIKLKPGRHWYTVDDFKYNVDAPIGSIVIDDYYAIRVRIPCFCEMGSVAPVATVMGYHSAGGYVSGIAYYSSNGGILMTGVASNSFPFALGFTDACALAGGSFSAVERVDDNSAPYITVICDDSETPPNRNIVEAIISPDSFTSGDFSRLLASPIIIPKRGKVSLCMSKRILSSSGRGRVPMVIGDLRFIHEPALING